MTDPPSSRILLIDDEPNLLFGLTAVMKRAGFEVLTASNGKQGLERAQHDHPDMIVCDMMMPPPNGLQLKQLLAAEPATASIPFIFLTARTNMADKLAGLSSGADDYMTKPFKIEELLERVRTVLRRHEAAHQQGVNEAKVEIEQWRDQALRDPSTGLFNRRYLEESLIRELSRAKREAYPVALTMLNIDHFKQINDHYGHPVGDRFLQALGQQLQQHSRPYDLVCRYGGEEFVLMLPNIPFDAACRRAEQWRANFQNLRLCDAGTEIPCATLSIGLALFPLHAASPQALIASALQALYAAKQAGRNQVRVGQADHLHDFPDPSKTRPQ
jgi:diguanylate cyclase (GGDEF)-like protein